MYVILIFHKIGRHLGGHLGFLRPHHDSSESPLIFLHLRYTSNPLCDHFLWTSRAHRHPLRDWSMIDKGNIHNLYSILTYAAYKNAFFREMKFWPHCYTMVLYQGLFWLSVYKNPAVYLSGAFFFLSFYMIHDFGSPTINQLTCTILFSDS